MNDLNEQRRDPIMNIYQRLNKVKEKVTYLQRDAEIPTGGTDFQNRPKTYKAITHDKVTAETRQHFIDAGVIVTISLKSGGYIEIGKNKWGQVQRAYDAVYVIKFINMDDPKDYLKIKLSAQGTDTSDKHNGKACSMAMKTAILKVLQIPTGENEEERIELAPENEPAQTDQQKFNHERMVNEVEALAAQAGVPIPNILESLKADDLMNLSMNELGKAKNRLLKNISKQGAKQ